MLFDCNMGLNNLKETPAVFAFENKVRYFGEYEQDASLFLSAPIRFSGPMLNVSALTKDALCAIFSSVPQLSFLGLVSQVCQLWYSVVTEQDLLWERFLLQKRVDRSKSARVEVYTRWFRANLVWIPDCYMEKVRHGYYYADDEVKVLLYGDESVGKTCLMLRQLSGAFIQQPEVSEEEVYRLTREYHELLLRFEVLDSTPSCASFAMYRDQWTQTATAYLVLYSVTSRDSFYHAQVILRHIYQINDCPDREPQFQKPIILVGSKCDEQLARCVSFAEGLALAKEWNIGFIETSAKSGENVTTLFNTIGELYLLFSTFTPIKRRMRSRRD